MNEIIIALITGGLSLAGVIYSNKASEARINHQFEVSQAVMNTKIDELTREVREHNNFAKRMPVVENEIGHLADDIHKLQSYHT